MIENPYDSMMKLLEIIPNPQRERNMSKNYTSLLLREFVDCDFCSNFKNCGLENCVFGYHPL
jgi:hypothetical protein